jgi:hypothetical protein
MPVALALSKTTILTGLFVTLAAALAATLSGCGETWQWDGDSQGDPKESALGAPGTTTAFGPREVVSAEDSAPPEPAVGLARKENAWIITGSGKATAVKIFFECKRDFDAKAQACMGEDGAATPLSTLRLAFGEDPSGALTKQEALGPAREEAAALMAEALEGNTARSASAFVVLEAGEEGLQRGGFAVTLPLGGELLAGEDRVLLVERSDATAGASSYVWYAFTVRAK